MSLDTERYGLELSRDDIKLSISPQVLRRKSRHAITTASNGKPICIIQSSRIQTSTTEIMEQPVRCGSYVYDE